MKTKNGKSPRPKFHIIMPIDKETDANTYKAMKEKVYSIFPFVDSQALDAARFLYGTAEPKVDYIDGYRTLTDFLKEYDNNEKRFSELGEVIHEGRRNATMHSIALKLIKRYGLCEESLDKYREASNKCSPPLEKGELNTIWKSALKYLYILIRKPLSVRVLTEKYIASGEYGYAGIERLDAKITDVNAIKALSYQQGGINATQAKFTPYLRGFHFPLGVCFKTHYGNNNNRKGNRQYLVYHWIDCTNKSRRKGDKRQSQEAYFK